MKRVNEIRNMRMNMGKFLHSYYMKFGEEKYEEFLRSLGPTLEKEFGEPFSKDNLRIMEAEFITFNALLNDKKKNRKNTKL